MQNPSKLAIGAAIVAAGILGVATPSTAATPLSSQAAMASAAKIVPAAPCIGGIEYWQTSSWNPFQGAQYYAHARNCTSTSKRMQFSYRQGGYMSCETLKPHATLIRQSNFEFNGIRHNC